MTKITPIRNLQVAKPTCSRQHSASFQNRSFKLAGENAIRVNKMTQTLDSYIKAIKENAQKVIANSKFKLDQIALLTGITSATKLSKNDSQNDVFTLSKIEEKNQFVLKHKEISYPWWQKEGIYNEKEYTISNDEINASGFDMTDDYIEAVISKANKAFFGQSSKEEETLDNAMQEMMHPQLRKGFKGELRDFIKAFKDPEANVKELSENHIIYTLKTISPDKKYLLEVINNEANVLVTNQTETKPFCIYNIVKKAPNFIQSTSFEQISPEYLRCELDNYGQISHISKSTKEDEAEENC